MLLNWESCSHFLWVNYIEELLCSCSIVPVLSFGCRLSGPSETCVFLGCIIKDKMPFGAVAQQALINTKKGTKFK